MNNRDISNYFQDIAVAHVRDSISNSQQDGDMDAWKTKTNCMGRLSFRIIDDCWDGPQIREMMEVSGLDEAEVLVMLARATAEAFEYEMEKA